MQGPGPPTRTASAGLSAKGITGGSGWGFPAAFPWHGEDPSGAGLCRDHSPEEGGGGCGSSEEESSLALKVGDTACSSSWTPVEQEDAYRLQRVAFPGKGVLPYEGRQGKAASCSIYMLLRFSLRQLSHSEAVGVTHQVLFVIQCAPHRSHRQLRVLPADLDKENHHRAQQDGHQDGQKDCKDHSWGRERGSASGAGKGRGFAFTKAGRGASLLPTWLARQLVRLGPPYPEGEVFNQGLERREHAHDGVSTRTGGVVAAQRGSP